MPLVDRLASFGDRAALVTSEEVVSYAGLSQRIDALLSRLGTSPRLVLLPVRNDVDSVVAYLAALRGGHPVLLTDADNEATVAAMVRAYDPDVVVRGDALEERHLVSVHDLHPSLALLLSTSGTTGSAKLVRLSAENLQANAEAIASYLRIGPADVAATTLPLHYCYGLSVLNSHLTRGAALFLTELSVVDACFWDQFRRHGCTSFAGVPYTFDLLDRVGFDSMSLPSLRYVTQAGGRMPAAQVTRYARLGRRRGFDLVVMYGQTEATARMAYLPPESTLSHPTTIGVPVPGGSFTLDPVPELGAAAGPDTGELVYHGANVMLGYAEAPEDLALGRTVTALRTGDIARRHPTGHYEIIGRRSRFAKIFGLRIDLGHVEAMLADSGVPGHCVEAAGTLVVSVEAAPTAAGVAAVEQITRRDLGLPPAAVRTRFGVPVPRLPSGKPDHRALTASAAAVEVVEATGERACTCTRGGCACAGLTSGAGTDLDGLRKLYGQVLRRSDVTVDDSFVSLGGDSLSYVEMSIRLEELIGHLPSNWHLTPIAELVPSTRRGGTGLRTLETNVLLRAAAIVLIVGSHSNVFAIAGGAHVLLAMVGFNFGRFHLTAAPRLDRVRHLAGSIGRIVVPSVLWIGAAALVTSAYSWQTVTLLNGALGPAGWSEPAWHYWFIEALVYTLLALTALMAVPLVDRVERRWSFWLPVGLAALALLTRYEVVVLRGGDVIHRAYVVFWLFALGWATAKALTTRHRLVISGLVVATVPGFFESQVRGLVVIGGLLLLVWVPRVRLPATVCRLVGVLASASLYIYLSHWQVYPHLEEHHPVLALLLALAVGTAVWQVTLRAADPLARARRGLRGTAYALSRSASRRLRSAVAATNW